MIFTSYFAMMRNMPSNCIPISIARFSPSWYEGLEIKELSPSSELLSRCEQGITDDEEFTEEYSRFLNENISRGWFESKLSGIYTEDKMPIWESKTDHAVLLCYEKDKNLCHRTILTEHLNFLGIKISEISKEELVSMKTREQEKPSIFGIDDGIICQQVNCRGVMGAGLAKVIKETFPQVFDDYIFSCKGRTPKQLLGKIKLSNISGSLSIANIFSQLDYGNPKLTGKVYTDEDILIKCIVGIAKKLPDKKVYVPQKIGCGLGGGNWERILSRLEDSGVKNLYILDTFTNEQKRVLSPLSREDYLLKVVDILQQGIEEIPGRTPDKEWTYEQEFPAHFGLDFGKIEADMLDELRELVTSDDEIPDDLPEKVVGYLINRAITKEQNEYLSKMPLIRSEIEYARECYDLFSEENCDKERDE